MTRQVQQLHALTSIRGIAALGVVLFHLHESHPGQTIWLEWFSSASMGVDLFFVLSGFILAHVYRDFVGHTPTLQGWRQFIIARIARIYPLHLVTLVTMLVLVIVWPTFAKRYADYTSPLSFVLNLLLVQNWGLIRVSWNIPSWSISAEWFMYLLFPLLAMPKFWLTTSARALLVLMVTIIAAQLALVHFKGWDDYGGMTLGGMSRVVFEFSLGFAARHYWSRIDPAPGRALDAIQIACAMGLVVSLAFTSVWFCFVPFSAALICTLASPHAVLSRTLSAKTLVYLGDISYSLYMWHWLILNTANTLHLTSWFEGYTYAADISAMLQLGLSLLVAILSYHLIEQPCRKKLSTRLSVKDDPPKPSILTFSSLNAIEPERGSRS